MLLLISSGLSQLWPPAMFLLCLLAGCLCWLLVCYGVSIQIQSTCGALPYLSVLQVGFFGRSLQACSQPNSSSFVILDMPSRLTALWLLCKTPVDPQECKTLQFMHGALPASLRSLSIRGIAASIQAPYSGTSGNAAGWPVVGDNSSSSSSKGQPEGPAQEAGAIGDKAAGSGSSSSSVMAPGGQPAAAAAAAAAAESAGGAVLPAALPLLQRAELTVESVEDAADMIRWALEGSEKYSILWPLMKAL
jgi:hypothetical protein